MTKVYLRYENNHQIMQHSNIRKDKPFSLLHRYRIIKLVQCSFMIRILRKLGKEGISIYLIKANFKKTHSETNI